MEKEIFSGKNLDEALLQAAHFFAVESHALQYEILHDNSAKGLLSKLFSRPGIRIQAWVAKGREDLQAAARRIVEEAIGKKTLSWADPTVKTLLDEYNRLFFAGFDVPREQVVLHTQEKDVLVEVDDDFFDEILSKSDKLSLAYEHVFKRISQKKMGDVGGRLLLTAGASSDKRRDRLVGMAKNLAAKVQKTGKSVVLSSKSSQERKIIHLALDGLEGIATKSVGMGDKRKLVIYSTQSSPKKRDDGGAPSSARAASGRRRPQKT